MKIVEWLKNDLRDEHSKTIAVQKPNPPLLVGFAGLLLAWLLSGSMRNIALTIGLGAFIIWSLQEIFKGVNLFRRILGLSALVTVLVSALLLKQ